MAHQTRPFIGVNIDYIPTGKHTHAHFRLPIGYVDSILAAGGLPLLLPPLGKEKELNAFLDRVSGFVLSGGMDLDPRRHGLPTHPAVRPMPERRDDSDRLLVRLLLDRQLPLLFTAEWIEANPGIRDMLLMIAPMLPPTPPETAQHAMAGLWGWSSYDRLPQIRTPTLVVHGDHDVIIPVDNAHVLAERIPGARLHIVEGAGHGYPAQDPVGVHQLVTDFCRTRGEEQRAAASRSR